MSLMKKIETEKAPKAVGPYSQAISVNCSESKLLFVSGQLPIDPKTGALVEGDIRQSANRVLDNIAAILEAAHCTFENVVRMEIFMIDLTLFQLVNEEYNKRFNSHLPARQTIQVARLPLNASIEISCIAAITS